MERFHGHLNKVAWWTTKFAEEMFPAGSAEAKSARQWGYLAGLWHDLGKYPEKWQSYLRAKTDTHSDEVAERIDHATAGARHAVTTFPVIGHILAFAIAGHHSGLLDTISDHACQEKRLKNSPPDLSSIPAEVLAQAAPQLPASISRDFSSSNISAFTRMLFSCLVDADFLATETFMSQERSQIRPKETDGILAQMLTLLEKKVASFGPPATPVAQSRASVYQRCLDASDQDAGLFSLNVPTGGGKTLSSLAFALRHAILHGQKRVIYVIPFTSIIEQNAAVFEEVFAPLTASCSSPIVLEHHSNLSPEKETTRSRLAAENWDAPLIVTTAVQFYESLHAARTSSCRKLHRIANSVVILDEAQCLPVDYLDACLSTVKQLSAHYQTSVVLCTATQPAIHQSEEFPIGLPGIRPIIADARLLYRELERVKVVDRGSLDDGSLVREIAAAPQVLAIVNTRKHAQKLFALLPEEESENFHLSALMCPEHRQNILEIIRSRLYQGLPTRLISTQLIEAGVDVDFPLVYRSLAGIDSIAQASGRCNRNGALPLGETHIFRSEHQRAEAYFRDTAQVAEQVLALHDDPLSLESVELFFRLYYLGHNPPSAPKWDSKDIQADFKLVQSRDLPFLFQFKTVAEKFRLIENQQVPVIIPYDEKSRGLVTQLRNASIHLRRELLRSLQRYTVQIYETEYRRNLRQFESLRDDQFHVLICPETHYSKKFGLHLDSDNDKPLIC